MVESRAWHGMTQTEHEALRDQWAAKGYRFVSVSIYGSVDDPVFAAVMVQQAEPVAQRDWPVMTEPELQVALVVQAAQGFGPVIVAATGTADDHRFSAVFEPQATMPRTTLGLTLGSADNAYTDPATIQGANYAARHDGLILSWAASYGTPDDRRFAGIWQPNPRRPTRRAARGDATLWNCDGVDDTADYYQARFDAEKAAWIRPGFVTVGPGNTYMSVFVANEMGPQQSRHNMTPEEYQTQFTTLKGEGYFPVCVQACGTDAASARFAALFVQQLTIVPRKFIPPTGPGPDIPDIDNVVQTLMLTPPAIRHAALAIVHGTKLVYARGYTLAEPDWPVVQPTTLFRLASVSELPTALGIFQLIEAGVLDPARSLQDILNLTAIGGGPPKDPNFSKVTIQSLLEHTSGLKGPKGAADVLAAFRGADILNATLPVTSDMVNAYVASQQLVSQPGKVQVYSPLGYYLLGQVIIKLIGLPDLATSLQPNFLSLLGIGRIRAGVDLLADQSADEARYQAATFPNPVSDLTVAQSLMTPDQPLVASGYGDNGVALAGGGGGLSGAATDIARLVAILLDTNDNPALKRVTLEQMLSQAAVNNAARYAIQGNSARAGFGLDSAGWRGPGIYYGQKGGSNEDSVSGIWFDAESTGGESADPRWGLVALFGTNASQFHEGYWGDVMNIAKKELADALDLFPQFGMPSL
jgi:CubicO group peptidase (beta-lactamase class C family)